MTLYLRKVWSTDYDIPTELVIQLVEESNQGSYIQDQIEITKEDIQRLLKS